MIELTADADRAGIEYVRRGWSVIPIEAHGSRPQCDWQPFAHRLADWEEIDDWSWRFPHANIGIVTGALSGLVVIETEPRLGGRESLARLEALHGRLPATVEAATWDGGRQFYFAHPGGIVPCIAALLPGITLSGDGGYVVAPPSADAMGVQRAWLPKRGPGDLAVASLPSWLLALTREADQRDGTGDHWHDLARSCARGSQRRAAIAALADHLRGCGIDGRLITELVLAWNHAHCEPPLDDIEAHAMSDHVAGVHLDMREEAIEDAA